MPNWLPRCQSRNPDEKNSRVIVQISAVKICREYVHVTLKILGIIPRGADTKNSGCTSTNKISFQNPIIVHDG